MVDGVKIGFIAEMLDSLKVNFKSSTDPTPNSD